MLIGKITTYCPLKFQSCSRLLKEGQSSIEACSSVNRKNNYVLPFEIPKLLNAVERRSV